MTPPDRVPKSRYSIQIFQAFGIPVCLHFTFVLFLIWVAYRSRPNALFAVSFVSALFGCVLLHELGHALMARKFKIGTASITLYPIGGIALLTDRPEPAAEVWIAFAGPAVNLVIAAGLWVILLLQSQHNALGFVLSPNSDLLRAIFTANLWLAIFNLIPAFPMDGGRVVRAFLALRLPLLRATTIAANLGRIVAVCMIAAGFFGNMKGLQFIGFFVFLAASYELASLRTQTALNGRTVGELMEKDVRLLDSSENLAAAATIFQLSPQSAIPVVFGSEVIGVLTRDGLAAGSQKFGAESRVTDSMIRKFAQIGLQTSIASTAVFFRRGRAQVIIVLEEGKVVGLLTPKLVEDFIRRGGPQQPRETA